MRPSIESELDYFKDAGSCHMHERTGTYTIWDNMYPGEEGGVEKKIGCDV